MSEASFTAGDVVWAPDPYTAGTNPRPWLVLSADLPYAGEEYICAGLTLSDLPANVAVSDDDWLVGGGGDTTSYCSPWVVATVKHDAVVNPQGELTPAFTRQIVSRCVEYVTANIE
ncbi:MAG: hypothetical protein U5K28_01610 [Halobacteriales archaeon]|nr:hypothetical protein [Halobacteriales archaeon]